MRAVASVVEPVEPVEELLEGEDEDDRPTLEVATPHVPESTVMRAATRADVPEDDRPTLEEEIAPPPEVPERAAPPTPMHAWDIGEPLEVPPFVPTKQRRLVVIVAAVFAVSILIGVGFGVAGSSPAAPAPVPTAAFP